MLSLSHDLHVVDQRRETRGRWKLEEYENIVYQHTWRRSGYGKYDYLSYMFNEARKGNINMQSKIKQQKIVIKEWQKSLSKQEAYVLVSL